jgi:hypothetical protein
LFEKNTFGTGVRGIRVMNPSGHIVVLPGAPYQEAGLVFGEDEAGPYLGVTGAYTYTRAFGDRYRAVPRVTLHRDSAVLDASMTIENLAHDDQKVMGMALPSTCDPEGYTAEKKKGNVRTVPGLGRADFAVKAGCLYKTDTKKMESKIAEL